MLKHMCWAAACSALFACTSDVSEKLVLSAPSEVSTIDGLSQETKQELKTAEEVAARSPEHQIIERRYSAEAARGEVPLLVKSPDSQRLPFSKDKLDDVVAPYPTKDARTTGFTLQDALAASLANDAGIAEAQQLLSKAEIAETNAILGYAPRVLAIGELSSVRQNVLDTDNDVFQEGKAQFRVLNGRVEATQPVIDVARILAFRVAGIEARGAEIDYVSATQRAVVNTITAYMSALEAQVRSEGVGRRLDLLRKQLVAEKKLIEFGFETESAKSLVEVEIGRNEIELLEYRAALTTALTDLGTLIGQPIDRVTDLDLSPRALQSVVIGDATQHVATALRRNSELQRARLTTLALRREHDRQLAEDFAPRLELFGRTEYEDREASRFGGGSRTLDSAVGLRATIPLFNSSGRGYLSREAEKDAEIAILAENNLRRALEVEIRTVHNELKSFRSLIADSEKVLASAEQLKRRAERRVAAGQTVEVEVLRQQLQVERAREWAARSKYAFVRSWARFSLLTGVPFKL